MRAQLEHELAVIEKLDLAGYFLIVWDIARFARERGILCQGRGSAANSAVCYALGITAVDPVGMELLFERFLSEERGEWPDIDLDLPSGDQREKIIQYVYERYGPHGAGMTATVITYRTRSAVREMGKVLGLARGAARPPREAPAPAALPRRPRRRAGACCARPASTRTRPRIQLLLELAGQVQGLPRHLGQHTGGMVIAAGPPRRGGADRARRDAGPHASSSGTRTTAPTSASSRSTCSASACSTRSSRRCR